jgi:SAM-dependent methyltransferase
MRTGRLERAMARLGIAADIDAIDGSAVSIDIAHARAREEGLPGIRYRVADFNHVRLPRATYDVVVFHQSLHHVTSVEKLLERVLASLSPDGLLFLDEWTGPSRFEWNAERLARARSLRGRPGGLEMAGLRASADVPPRPSISAILPSVHRLFSPPGRAAYGGHLVSVLLPQLNVLSYPSRAGRDDRGLADDRGRGLARPRVQLLHRRFAVPRRGPGCIAGRLVSLASGLVWRSDIV